ncbi:MAG: efflux RND transporter permease subunit [Syntrophomonadaceae bacterium]|nr:efflux RND transporter permease subunit [Syntrophomonadaceae bacterium]
MKITNLALRRPSLIAVIFLALLILGLFSYTRLPADLLPKMEFPFVAVIVPYPGAGPEDVESKISKPLEDAMSSLNNIDSLRSFSQEGMSMIWIEYKLDADPNLAVEEVQRKYNAVINELPVEAEPATIQQFNINDTPILQMSVTGNLPEAELFNLMKNHIQPQLQQVKGVSRVVLLGGKEREIQIEIQPERLHAYQLSILQILPALQSDNQNVPAGKIEDYGLNYVVRIKSQASKLEELENIVVARTPDGPVYLRDIARVHDTYKEDQSIIRLNGEPGIGLLVFKRSDANTIETNQKVTERVAQLENQFGIQIALAYDSAEFIRDSLQGMQEELLMAILIVALVIFLFLGSWRGSLIILLSIPISLISTLIFVKLFDFSLNLMTLMGAALVVGIIVDDSIVVLENIQRHIEKGTDRLTAVQKSIQEIGIAVIGISLTLVIVFLPVALVPGIAGKIFREFGLVIVCATLLSLLVALTLIPLLASRLSHLGNLERSSWLTTGLKAFNRFLVALSSSYARGINWTLNHKKTVLSLALTALIASGALIPLRIVGTEFIPKIDRGEFILKLKAAPGTSLNQMDTLVKEIESEVGSLPEVKQVFTSVGFITGEYDASSASNLAELRIILQETGVEKSASVKQKVKAIADRRAGLESAIGLTSIWGSAEDADVRLEVRGYNLEELKQVTEMVSEVVALTPGTRDVRTTIESGLPEYNIRVDRAQAAAHGLLTGEVTGTLGLFLTGKVVSKFSEGEDQYDVRLIGDPAARNHIPDIPELLITSPMGEQIRLDQIARFSQGSGLKKIERVGRQRVFVVNANLEGRSLGDAVNDIKTQLNEKSIPPGVNLVFEGYQKFFEDSMRDLSLAMLLSAIFVYLIMVAIFESFLLPFTIWFSVPMALIGALLALAITRQTLNIFSMIGMIMLIGLVTKNAILLVDFANILRKQGMSIKEALIQAGSMRLRPILMTTVTMVLAMVPLALGLSTGSEMRRGMSIALIGGLISSTILTLFVVPVIYQLLEGLKAKIYHRWQKINPSSTN